MGVEVVPLDLATLLAAADLRRCAPVISWIRGSAKGTASRLASVSSQRYGQELFR